MKIENCNYRPSNNFDNFSKTACCKLCLLVQKITQSCSIVVSVVQNCTGKNWEENPAVLVQDPLFARIYGCSLWAEISAGGIPLLLFIIAIFQAHVHNEGHTFHLAENLNEQIHPHSPASKHFRNTQYHRGKIAKGIPLGQKLGQNSAF